MLERDGYPAGVPCWVDTEQPDTEAAAAFYGGVFGWELTDSMPAGSEGRYYIARLDGKDVAAIASAMPGSAGTPTWNTYVWVDSADATAKEVEAAGGQVLVEPFDVPEAGRMAICADPAGAAFRLWQARGHRGAQLVDQPGSWVFSNLSSTETDRAKAFYGAVFGWEGDTIDFGAGPTTMWRRPGYAEHLAINDPGLPDRLVEFKAPPGFGDAVAWMSPPSPGTSDEARWDITFAVDDTDAAVARAAGLGATVLVAPHNVGPVRDALLRDPQGAVFTVSRFQPE